MMMIETIKGWFGVKTIEEPETVESEETPDDEETKFAMSITDEMATEAENEIDNLLDYHMETLGAHAIDMKELSKQFEDLGEAEEMPSSEDRPVVSRDTPLNMHLGSV